MSILACSNKTSKTEDLDFDKFWEDFRNSVLNIEKDTSSIMNFVNFPLETKGDDEYSPIIRYNRNEFISIFKDYLSRPVGPNPKDHETAFYSIKKQKKAKLDASNRIDDMIFKKVDGNWKLTFLYYFKRKDN